MKKKVINGVLSLSLLGGLVPSMMFANPAVNNNDLQQQSFFASESRVLNQTAINTSDINWDVIGEASLLNSYISEGSDGLLYLDPKGKEIVSADTYQIVIEGIEVLNNSLKSGSTTIQDGLVVAKQNTSSFASIQKSGAFANQYWWGVALTFNKTDATLFAQQLKNFATGFGAEAAIAGLITALFPNPGTFAAAAAGAIMYAGYTMVAESIITSNSVTNNGITLNLHWIPVTYYEVTRNSKVPY
ncbi:hypothetical protein [Paenibacillus sp. Z3-2]